MSIDTQPGGYISEIELNNGDKISLKPNDIVIFVGPNNVGKSQALKDIFALSDKSQEGMIVKSISIQKYSASIVPLLQSLSTENNCGNYSIYKIFGSDIVITHGLENAHLKEEKYSNLRPLFVDNLDTSARLSICNPPPSIRVKGPKSHPIHYVAFNPVCREWLSSKFKKAFQTDVIPNTFFGSEIPLCMGEQFNLGNDYNNEIERQEAVTERLANYPQVHEQGDGVKSFTGILLHLMLKHICTFIIDEPESFLHPPQAKIMGQIIGETLTDKQQAFISTHSEEIIKGIVETCPERIKIIRITRDADINHFAILDNEKLQNVWNDSLMKHSNIMSGLFHKKVILCESDSDCKMYSIIEDHLCQSEGVFSETLFIHCGGKHRIPKVAEALIQLGVDISVIVDLDVLNNVSLFKNLVTTFGVAWDELENDYNLLISNINPSQSILKRNDIRDRLNQIIDKDNSVNLSTDEIKRLKEALHSPSKWDDIKKYGENAIPRGNAFESYKRVCQQLIRKRIFLVPTGELEGFLREVGGHGPEWVNTVLQEYPDLNAPKYDSIKNFVAKIRE